MQILILLIISFISIFIVRYAITSNLSVEKFILIFLSFIVGFIAFNYPVKSVILLIFSMLLSPELKVGDIPGRSVVVRYDDIFLIVLFLAYIARSAVYKGKVFIVKTPLNLPLVIYTLSYILSTAIGVIRGDIIWKKAFFYVLKYTEYFMLYFMVLNILSEEKDFKKFAKYGIFVLLSVIAYSYYYYFNTTGDLVRTTAPFEAPLGKPEESEPASLGGYYIIWSFLILSYISETNNIKSIIFSLVLLSFLYISFLLTFSRASYYGITVGILFFLFLVRRKKIFFVWMFLFAFLFSVTLPGIGEKVKERIRSTYTGGYAVNPVETPFGIIKLEDSAYARYRSLMNVIFNVLPYYPLLGRGVTGIGLGDNQYALLLGESGIIGFLSFFWLIFTIISMSWKVYNLSTDILEKTLGLGMLCSTIALLAQGIGVNTFIIVRIMEPYWFCAALLSLSYMNKKNE